MPELVAISADETKAPGARKDRPGRRPSERIAIGLTVVTLLVATLPYLPPGICFYDAGDLQLAATTLGIMHPPGYPAYVTLGHLATLMPGVEPAYMVSLACLLSGIVALWIGVLIQVRLGVNPWIASAFMLSLTSSKRIWTNLVEPEVYAPSLMFLVGAVYLLIRYSQDSRRRDLYFAATVFGIAVANRPILIFTLPFFLAAWWAASRSVGVSRKVARLSLLYCSLFAALPGVYSLGYVWVRDTPGATYNYIKIKNDELQMLPDARDGALAKLERLWWHVTAREFKQYMGNTWTGARKRIVWLYKEFFLYQPLRCGIVLSLLACSAVVAYRRCKAGAWLLTGMALSNVAFICIYKIYGYAADMLPLVFSVTVLTGVATSVLVPAQCEGRRRAAAIVLMLAMCIATVVGARDRGPRDDTDGEPFLAELNMATLPANTMMCSLWKHSTVLWYSKHVMTHRHDIRIVNTTPNRWLGAIESAPERPALITMRIPELKHHKVVRYRNVWMVERD